MGVGARAARGVESYGGQAEKHTEQLGSSARVTRLRAAQQWCAVAAAYIQAHFRMLLSLCRTVGPSHCYEYVPEFARGTQLSSRLLAVCKNEEVAAGTRQS